MQKKLEKQRAFFRSGRTIPLAFRKKALDVYKRQINGILTNEKYIGDALFQKTITDAAFKRKRNYGEEEQYYCEDHHKAIIDRDTFEKAKEAIRQRGLEKGNCSEDTSKYQNRYVMSGKIKCGECGRSFKRRYHYTSHGLSLIHIS